MKQLVTSILLLMVATGQSFAAEEFKLAIKGHRFDPVELIVPAGKKIKLAVSNQDATIEEFESYALNREKIIRANSRAVIYIGPLTPGRYEYFGEFNKDTAQGVIVAK